MRALSDMPAVGAVITGYVGLCKAAQDKMEDYVGVDNKLNLKPELLALRHGEGDEEKKLTNEIVDVLDQAVKFGATQAGSGLLCQDVVLLSLCKCPGAPQSDSLMKLSKIPESYLDIVVEWCMVDITAAGVVSRIGQNCTDGTGYLNRSLCLREFIVSCKKATIDLGDSNVLCKSEHDDEQGALKAWETSENAGLQVPMWERPTWALIKLHLGFARLGTQKFVPLSDCGSQQAANAKMALKNLTPSDEVLSLKLSDGKLEMKDDRMKDLHRVEVTSMNYAAVQRTLGVAQAVARLCRLSVWTNYVNTILHYMSLYPHVFKEIAGGERELRQKMLEMVGVDSYETIVSRVSDPQHAFWETYVLVHARGADLAQVRATQAQLQAQMQGLQRSGPARAGAFPAPGAGAQMTNDKRLTDPALTPVRGGRGCRSFHNSGVCDNEAKGLTCAFTHACPMYSCRGHEHAFRLTHPGLSWQGFPVDGALAPNPKPRPAPYVPTRPPGQVRPPPYGKAPPTVPGAGRGKGKGKGGKPG